MGLESINKASAATQSVQTTAPVTANVQAAGSSTQTADYTAAQAVQLSLGQDSASPESQESKATLADVKDISKVLNSNTVAEFGVYEPMNRITIKIKDKETGEAVELVHFSKLNRQRCRCYAIAQLPPRAVIRFTEGRANKTPLQQIRVAQHTLVGNAIKY